MQCCCEVSWLGLEVTHAGKGTGSPGIPQGYLCQPLRGSMTPLTDWFVDCIHFQSKKITWVKGPAERAVGAYWYS
jgi:hypothetical protein